MIGAYTFVCTQGWQMMVFRYVTKDVATQTNHLQFLESHLIGSVIFLL